MFEHHHDYPTAITQNGADDPQGAQLAALEWAASVVVETGGTILIYAPSKSSIDDDTILGQAAKRSRDVTVGTTRDRSAWRGGPVIAAWPSRESLATIADDRRTRALCVIPWVDNDITPWRIAADPQLLGTADALSTSAGSNLDPVVIAGLKTATHMVNQSNNLASTMDKRDAVTALQILHRAGYPLPADDVYAWALANGWHGRGAERLRDFAERIDAGRVVRTEPTAYRHDILDQWRAEAAGEK